MSLYAQCLVPDFPGPGSEESYYTEYYQKLQALSPQLKDINAKLVRAGSLTSLFETLYALGIGTTKSTLRSKPGEKAVTNTTVVNVSNLKLSGAGFTFSLQTRNNIWGDGRPEEVTVQYHSTFQKVKNLDDLLQIEELKKKRSQALLKFAQSLVALGMDAVSPGLGTGLNYVVSVVQAQMNPSISSTLGLVEGGVDMSSKDDEQISKILKLSLSSATNLASLLEEEGEINRHIQLKIASIRAGLFDTGGISRTGYKNSIHFSEVYDLITQLQIDDLNKNGLRSNIYRKVMDDTNDPKQAKDAVDDFDEAMSKNAKTYSYDEPLPSGQLAGDPQVSAMTQSTYQLFSGTDDTTINQVGTINLSYGVNHVFTNITDEPWNSVPKWFKNSDGYISYNHNYYNRLAGIDW